MPLALLPGSKTPRCQHPMQPANGTISTDCEFVSPCSGGGTTSARSSKRTRPRSSWLVDSNDKTMLSTVAVSKKVLVRATQQRASCFCLFSTQTALNRTFVQRRGSWPLLLYAGARHALPCSNCDGHLGDNIISSLTTFRV